jgi:hypothetical protein
MGSGGRTSVVLLALVALVALVTGCGGGEVGIDAGTPSPSPPGTAGITTWDMASQVPDGWTMQTAEAVGMRASDDGRALAVDAVLLPVRLPDGTCAGEVGVAPDYPVALCQDRPAVGGG